MTFDNVTYPSTIAHSSAPTACSAQIGSHWPKNGIVVGSVNRMAPPSTRPPNPNVRLQKATVLPICSGVSPQCA